MNKTAIKMKRIILSSIFTLLISCMWAQQNYDCIYISKISNIGRKNKTLSQYKLDFKSGEISTRKRPNKKWKVKQTNQDLTFFKDSVDYNRLKAIALSTLTKKTSMWFPL